MHCKLDRLTTTGYTLLRDYAGPPIAPAEWQALIYLGASGDGEVNFAPLASATGELDGRDFWQHGRPDKGGQWTPNCDAAPGLARYVAEVGAGFGRVRVVKLGPTSLNDAMRQLRRDDGNRLNPEQAGWVVRSWLELDDTPHQSVFILRERRDDAGSETRIRLHPGMQLVIDSDRLWHTVWHPGPRPRYALVTSWESGPALDHWLAREAPPRRSASPRSLPFYRTGAGWTRHPPVAPG
jgi:hypothetical protein